MQSDADMCRAHPSSNSLSRSHPGTPGLARIARRAARSEGCWTRHGPGHARRQPPPGASKWS